MSDPRDPRVFGAIPLKKESGDLKTAYGAREKKKIDTLKGVRESIQMANEANWFEKYSPTQTDIDKATKRNQQIAAAEDYRKFKKACEKLGTDLKRRARGEEPRTADFVFEKDFIAPLRDSRKKASSASPVCGGDSKKYSTAVTRVGCSGGDRAVSVASLVSPRVSSSY